MIKRLIIAAVLLLSFHVPAHAQYQNIPNYGNNCTILPDQPGNAGYCFRSDVNGNGSGARATSPQLVHLYANQLPATVVNGQMYYINDGTVGSPCTGGGTGAIAQGINGVWVCTGSAAPPVPPSLVSTTVWNPWQTSKAERIGTGTGSAGPYNLTLAHTAVIGGLGAAQPVTLYVNGVAQGTDYWGAGQITGSGISGTSCGIDYELGTLNNCTFTAVVGSGVAITISYTYAMPPSTQIAGYVGQMQGLSNVTAWGAVGSGNGIGCTATAGSAVLPCSGAIPANLVTNRYVEVVGGGSNAAWNPWGTYTPPAPNTAAIVAGSQTITLTTSEVVPKGEPITIAGNGIVGGPLTTFTTGNCNPCTSLTINAPPQGANGTYAVTFGPTVSPKTWTRVPITFPQFFAPINTAQGAGNDYGSYEGCTIDAAASLPAFQNNHAYAAGDVVGAAISITDRAGQSNPATGIYYVPANGAGTSATSGAPTWPTVWGNAVLTGTAHLSLVGLAAPSTNNTANTGCAQVYGYRFYPVDHLGRIGTPSPIYYTTHQPVMNSDGPAVFGTDNRILLQWTDPPDPMLYANIITRCKGSGCTPTTTIHAIVPTRFDNLTNWLWDMTNYDTGTRVDPSGTRQITVPATLPSPQNVNGVYIVTQSGTSLTLSAPMTTSGPVYVMSDDWPAAQAAVRYGCAVERIKSAGNPSVYFPASAGWLLGQPLQMIGCNGPHVYGAGGAMGTGSGATTINYIGPPGGVALDVDMARDGEYDHMNLSNNSGNNADVSLPGFWIDDDRYGYSGVTNTANNYHDMSFGAAGDHVIDISRANPTGNVENHLFTNLEMHCRFGLTTQGMGWSESAISINSYLSAAGQTNLEKFKNVFPTCSSIGWASYFSGEIEIDNLNGWGNSSSLTPPNGVPFIFLLGSAKQFLIKGAYDENGGKLAEIYGVVNMLFRIQDSDWIGNAVTQPDSSFPIMITGTGRGDGGFLDLDHIELNHTLGTPIYPNFVWANLVGSATLGQPVGASYHSFYANSDPFASALMPAVGQNTVQELADVGNLSVANGGWAFVFANAMAGHYNCIGLGPPALSTGALSITPTSTDACGKFTVVSTNPTTSATITFALPYGTQPHCSCSEDIGDATQQFIACGGNAAGTQLIAKVPTDFHSANIHYSCQSNGN